MPRYWVMRTDPNNRAFLWDELNHGRLRQGWGYREDQDLRHIAPLVRDAQQLNDDQRLTWRGNRRLLDTEPDGIRANDIIVVPNLPAYGVWSLVRVTGRYDYQIPEGQNDYGHFLLVKLLTPHAINPREEAVSARLRQTMRAQGRLWNIDRLSPDVERLVAAIQAGQAGDIVADRLPGLLEELERAAWASLTQRFQGREFERPCVLLLRELYGEEAVEYTSGRTERGADAICTYNDPLGVEHRVVVQIKMWEWEAGWTRPLEQIRQAYYAYAGITAGVILSTAEQTTQEFEQARQQLEADLHIPVRVVLRKELLRLLITYLPVIAGGDE